MTRTLRNAAFDEEVLIVGAGAAGLATAGALTRYGVSALVLEREERAGASWWHRYDGLRLNTVRWMSDLPGHRMGRSHGRWPSRRAWAGYLEHYARRTGLRIRTGAEVTRVDRREAGGFTIHLRDGTLTARILVIATGHDHTPVAPDWPGREQFTGRLMHASEFRDAGALAGRDVLVVGSGNSGVEIATLVNHAGARSTRIAIRTPPLLLRRELLGFPLTPLAIPGRHVPDRLLDQLGWAVQRGLFGDLTSYGLPRSPQRLSDMKHRYFSPPMDSGFVTAVKAGRIEVVAAVERFEGPEVLLIDRTRHTPDVVIAATGYRTGLSELLGSLGVVRDDGEPSVHGPTGLDGLYFAGFTFGLAALLPYLRADARATAEAIVATIRRAENAAAGSTPSRYDLGAAGGWSRLRAGFAGSLLGCGRRRPRARRFRTLKLRLVPAEARHRYV